MDDEMLKMPKSRVYVLPDESGKITRIEGEYSLPDDLTGWTLIDEGEGDRYNLAQTHYLEGNLLTPDGIYRYKLVAGMPVLRSAEEITADRNQDISTLMAKKLDQINAACSAAITAGVDVETSAGTEHFGLEETDQINLATALDAVKSGGTSYPYHADGKLCRMFTAAEIIAIAQASVRHKLIQTTYCNHLRAWVKRCETADEITAIVYGDALPGDLQSNMEAVLAAAQGDNNG